MRRLCVPAYFSLLSIRDVELAFGFAFRKNMLVEELSPSPPQPPVGGIDARTMASAAAAFTTPPHPWTVDNRFRLLHIFAVGTGTERLDAGAVGPAPRSSE